jgi:hypothetical protein
LWCLAVSYVQLQDNNTMRIFKTIILYLFAIQSFSQNIDSLFSKQKWQNKLKIEIKKDKGPLGSFPTERVAKITFKTDSASVYYFAFQYNQNDSINFRKAEDDYWIVSGCNTIQNKSFNKNFHSFIYGGYFFLLQHCACRTGLNENCAELASSINQLRKEN